MLPKHKDVLFDVADFHSCWIGVREPNELAERWIGKPGCIPKGPDCKAKTADNPKHALGGLVVDPTLTPAAFATASSLELALESWKKFAVHGRLPRLYSRSEHGPDRGMVRYDGSAIHGDLDLMAICKADASGGIAFTESQEQEHLFARIEADLNRAFGVPLIQHGAEFMWTGGVGAKERENVLWFGPRRRFQMGTSSMPKGGH